MLWKNFRSISLPVSGSVFLAQFTQIDVIAGGLLNAQQTSLILHSPGKRSNKLSGTFSLHPFSPPLSVSLTIRRTSE